MSDLPVITLTQPLPGFPELHDFALVRLDPASPLTSLSSVQQPDVRFLVVPPVLFFPDYAPEVSADVVDDLQIAAAEDVLLLVLLTAGESLASTTANLAAPLLVNTRTRRARQVVLGDPTLPLAASLLESATPKDG